MHQLHSFIKALFYCAMMLAAQATHAGNTGGVFGPNVSEGHRSFQYRVGYDPDTLSLPQRLHYQQALNDDFMARLVVQTRKSVDRDLDYDFTQLELFWDLGARPSGWQHGMRFDLRTLTNDRPEHFGLNWMSEYNSGKWKTRLLALGAKQFGSGAASGVFLQTRGSVFYRSSATVSLGLEMYSSYGSTADLRSGDEQSHELGPAFVINMAGGWQLFAGALWGLTDASRDDSVRLWVTKKL